MAGRIRTIKPEILEDERTAGLSDAAFRVFICGILLCDDHGNFRASTSYLQGQIFWARGDSPRLAEVLGELRRADLVRFYEVRGQIYGSYPRWKKHQRIDNAGKARMPGPDDPEASDYEGFNSVVVTLAEIRREIPRTAETRGGSPPDPDPDPDQRPPTADHEVAPAAPLLFAEGSTAPLAKPKKPAKEPSEQTLLRDWWLEAFREATGSEHSWSAREAGQAAQLLRMGGGLAGVRERAEVLLGPRCPAWLAKGGRDMGTLLAHWNKLAPGSASTSSTTRGGGLQVEDFLAAAEEFERRGV